MSGNSNAPKPAAKGPARSPIERIIVWGAIAALLVLVGIEGYSRMTHASVVNSLVDLVKKAEDKGETVRQSEVRKLLGNRPMRSEELLGKNASNAANSVDIYEWFTLNPMNQRRLLVYYGKPDQGSSDCDVLDVRETEVETIDEKWKPPTKEQIAEQMKNNPPQGGPGPPPGGPGMAGPPGGPGAGPGGPGPGAAPAEEGAVSDPNASDPNRKPAAAEAGEAPASESTPSETTPEKSE